MKPVKVLYVHGGIMNRGGIQSYMMNYFRNLDRNLVQVDFIVHGYEKGAYDDEIKLLGGRIYNIPVKSKDYLGNLKALKAIFTSGEYKIVHSHMDAMGMIVLKQAKKYGVPVRIAHSHATQHLTKNKLKFILNEYARKRISYYATDLWACSKKAGEWLYGSNNKFVVINNAIDVEKFKFDSKVRDNYRLQMNLDGKFVLGHVGAFYFYKNHEFILEVFYEIVKRNSESILLLIGKGPLEEEIRHRAKELDLLDKILFLGERNDISELMQAMDILILPSKFEGLPVVIIEAQAASLPAIVSLNVTQEVKLSDIVLFEDLATDPANWAKKALHYKSSYHRDDISTKVRDKGYSISEEVRKIEKMYCDLYKVI